MSTESAVQTVEIKRFQCRHIFTDGHRCGSPALREENFCYFHHTTRKSISDPYHRASRRTRIELPMPEDRPALLLAIGEVLQGIASHTIDRKDASLLLYGLQIATSALPREARAAAPARANSRTQPRRSTHDTADLETFIPVEDTVSDGELGLIAQPSEFIEPEARKERRSLARQLLDEVEAYEQRTHEEQQEEEDQQAMESAAELSHSQGRQEGRQEAYNEAYSNLKEIIEATRTTAIADTETRLRAEFNLPPLESLATEPTHPQLDLPITLNLSDPNSNPGEADTYPTLNLNATAEPSSRGHESRYPTHDSLLVMGGMNKPHTANTRRQPCVPRISTFRPGFPMRHRCTFRPRLDSKSSDAHQTSAPPIAPLSLATSGMYEPVCRSSPRHQTTHHPNRQPAPTSVHRSRRSSRAKGPLNTSLGRRPRSKPQHDKRAESPD